VVVEGFGGEGNYPIVTYKKWQKNNRRAQWRGVWKKMEKVKAHIHRFRFAWHGYYCAQKPSMSMDSATMDLSDVFEYGQGYVALSRVRRLSGLHILGWNDRTFKVPPGGTGKR
jgi:hypothetical protein